MALPEAISVRKTAELLGVHPKTVREWIKRHYILAIRVGPKLLRIPRSEISRLRTFRATIDGRPDYPVV